ncbi:hypothetical protein JX265_010975 [Neoarthrinium moseri]|uniref:C2H2-type domain-containing protein n=1 Tax=Neoarthrinium moseri TaxID=1658444 RepID=A0A9P9WCZ9_9PEZI|nr:hypothetical protein JX266_003203 [Neoarthrinium moseri]KAI1857945.1 hypothetical protein JX265_010975 [Neoarthrinium moseri]
MDLLQHIETSENHKACITCHEEFESADNLDRHVEKNHRQTLDETTSADDSDITAVDEELVSVKHPKPTQRPCRICHTEYTTSKEYLEHYENGDCYLFADQFYAYLKANDVYGLFTTDELRSPPAVNALRLPLKVTGSATEYQNSQCAFGSTSEPHVLAHMESDVRQPTRFVCPQEDCDDRFPRFAKLMEHLQKSKCGTWVQNSENDGLKYLKSSF